MIKLINENEFIQQLRAIRKYFTKSYKQFIFEVVPEIKKTDRWLLFNNARYR